MRELKEYIGVLIITMFCFCCVFCGLVSVHSQPAEPPSQSLSIQEIFNASRNSLNIIEANSTASAQKIESLQNEVLQWQRETSRWENELIKHQENSLASEQALLMRFQDSEATLTSLNASITILTVDNQGLRMENYALIKTNKSMRNTIIIMSIILSLIIIYFAARFMKKIKTGGFLKGLIKK